MSPADADGEGRFSTDFLFGFGMRRLFTTEFMTESQTLLEHYVETGSEQAFRELVDSYINLVFSAAVRLLEGDQQRAEDVAQIVFADLARMAPRLSRDAKLGGWLHRHTCFVAKNILRAERRRAARERAAMDNVDMETPPSAVLPILDEAIDRLGSEDRAAIVLRFFEGRDFRSIGLALGSNEDAARMRVARAIEKLRRILHGRGVTLSTTALGAALAGDWITAAPAGLAVTISGAALTKAAITSGTVGVLKLMAITKLKIGIISALVLGAVTVPLLVQRQSQIRLDRENSRLRQALANQSSALQILSNRFVSATAEAALSQEQLAELMRLRSEVGRLRQEAQERLRVSVSTQKPAAVAEPVTPPNVLPKSAWRFAGYDTPEHALESVVWAMSTGDVKTCLASLTPDVAQRVQNKAAEDLGPKLVQEISRIGGLRLDRKKSEPDGSVSFVLFSEESDNGSEKFRSEAVLKFKNVSGEWKCADNLIE